MKLSPCLFFLVVLYSTQCINAQRNNGGYTDRDRVRQGCPPCNCPLSQQPYDQGPVQGPSSFTPPQINLNDHGNVIEICHKVYLLNLDRSKVTWDQADRKCKSLNLNLLSLETEQEQKCLNDHFADYNGQSYEFWTSGRSSPDQSFVWKSTNTPIRFNSWAYNQPDNRNGNQNCLVATFKDQDSYNAATWRDEKCDLKFRYICE